MFIQHLKNESNSDSNPDDLFLNYKRKKRKNKSDKDIYGIFASDEMGSSDDDNPQKSLKRHDSSRPIRFVSAGLTPSTIDNNPTILSKTSFQKSMLSETSNQQDFYDDEDPNNSDQELNLVFAESSTPSKDLIQTSKGSCQESQVFPSKDKIHKTTENDSSSNSSEDELSTSPSRFKFVDAKSEIIHEKKIFNSLTQPKHTWNVERLDKAYGVGFKMIQKMGYSGGSLGSKGHGLVNPIEVKVRTKNLGLQDIGEHTQNQFASHKEDNKSVLETLLANRTTDNQQKKPERWRANNNFKAKQSNYKSAFEAVFEALDDFNHKEKPSKIRILDMTGAQPRILESPSDFHFSKNLPYNTHCFNKTSSPLFSIKSSLNHLKVSTESMLKAVTRECKLEEEAFISFSHDHQNLSSKLQENENQIKEHSELTIKLKEIHTLLPFFNDREAYQKKIMNPLTKYLEESFNCDISTTKDKVSDAFVEYEKYTLGEKEFKELSYHSTNSNLDIKTLKHDESYFLKKMLTCFKGLGQNDYTALNLSIPRIALIFLIPVLKQSFENWNPTLNPTYLTSAINDWASYFVSKQSKTEQSTDLVSLNKFLLPLSYPFDDKPQTNLYSHFPNLNSTEFFRTWLENFLYCPIRSTLTNFWNPLNVEPALTLLEAWHPLLSESYFSTLCTEIIIPKLTLEINNWSQSSDPISINNFIHPWLPLLGDSANLLKDPIRMKIAFILQGLNPSDVSLIPTLIPWKIFFDNGTWESLISRFLIPKLEKYISFTPIQPDSQNLEPFQQLISWTDLVGLQNIDRLLDASFFPRWLKVLQDWLSFPSADYGEVLTWYQGWRALFPSELSSQNNSKQRFKQALTLINNFISQPVGNSNEQLLFEYSQLPQPTQFHNTNSPTIPSEPPPPTPEEMKEKLSLKSYLEVLATSNNLLLKPKAGRIIDGKQVYSFGRILIYIDNNIIFYLSHGHWLPVSIDSIVELGRGQRK